MRSARRLCALRQRHLECRKKLRRRLSASAPRPPASNNIYMGQYLYGRLCTVENAIVRRLHASEAILPALADRIAAIEQKVSTAGRYG
eukprot:3570803-Pyramimonas_sp.AAC.1